MCIRDSDCSHRQRAESLQLGRPRVGRCAAILRLSLIHISQAQILLASVCATWFLQLGLCVLSWRNSGCFTPFFSFLFVERSSDSAVTIELALYSSWLRVACHNSSWRVCVRHVLVRSRVCVPCFCPIQNVSRRLFWVSFG